LAAREALLRADLDLARGLSSNAPSGETSDLARALYHMADVLREKKALTEAQPLAQEAVAMYQRHPNWPLGKRQHAVVILENVLREGGGSARIEALLRDELGRLREISSYTPSKEIPSLGVILCHLAEVLRERKSLVDAQARAEEGAAMYRRHPDWPSK